MAAIAHEHRIRMIGPNCLGLMRPRVGLNATFARHGAKPGASAPKRPEPANPNGYANDGGAPDGGVAPGQQLA